MPATALVAAVVLIAYAFRFGQLTGGPAVTEDGISVYFSPNGGCTEAVVNQIDAAQHNIDVEAYEFTSRPIADALIAAHDRGVAVRVILDDKEAREDYSLGRSLVSAGIPVYTDAHYAIAHNKIMIMDGATVVTGSFNFTMQAEQSNAENLLVITGKPKLAQAYEENFQRHLALSQSYTSFR
ncbi:MAG TPA: phospholipase D family protein [Tepidisphaeraceae bacterium]|nr:phospholipase D family protein [Tepidisphaeraceae bacterium]